MPYIGASNSSQNSFKSLKEKHSIKKMIDSTPSSENGSESTLSLFKPNSTFEAIEEHEGEHNNKEDSVPSEISDLKTEEMKEEQQLESEINSDIPSDIPSEIALHNYVKPTYKQINRSKSIDSTISNLTEIDLQELYNLPNESTHSYSYNPLSPNSLAVRLSILKRSLEIIISNPSMLDEGTLTNINIPDGSSSNVGSRTNINSNDKITIPKHNHDNDNKDPRESDSVRSIRSMSLSVADNIPKYGPSQKWTSPTAALNAFVSNCNPNNGDRTNTDPNIRTSLTMNNISGKRLSNPSNRNNFSNINVSLSHRANSLAFLPKIMSTYNLQNKVNNNNYRDSGLKRVLTSRISFRQPFSSKNHEHANTTTPSSVEYLNNNSADEVPINETQVDGKGDIHHVDSNNEFISQQRADLINLLDLLNETLEKNTSSKASDLHMLSLFNINKVVLDKTHESEEPNEEYDDFESEGTLRLKRTLLDSLAQPFFERNIMYDEEALNYENTLQGSFDDLDKAQQAIENRIPKEDYKRILRTFASTKNSAPQAIFTCTQQYPWKFKAANDLACLIFGISNNILKALTLLDLIHTDSRNFVLHKILSTEDQELVFTGEIIGIVQPGNNSSSSASNDKNNLVWASIWAKRKNGLLVCVFEKVPCDYVDVMLNLDNFEVNSVLEKNNNNLLMECMTQGSHETPKFQLGGDDNDTAEDDSEDEYDTDTQVGDDIATTQTHIIHMPNDPENCSKKKSVKFANELRYISTVSQSLAKLIEQVRQGRTKNKDDDLLSMPVRVTNHINDNRYFSLNHLVSNVPCAVSASLVQNAIKLKIHSLPYIAGLFVIDSQTLQLVSFNRSVSKNMFGLHFNELVNKPMCTIIPEFDNLVEYIETQYPELDITLNSNRGLVLTEHFFRKIHGEMNNDPENFYISIGLDGRHKDGSVIKVDMQLRVVSPNISLVWVTHSRDVVLEDYQTNASQLSMLKESELAYISSSSSSTSLSRKSQSKGSDRSTKTSHVQDANVRQSPSKEILTSTKLDSKEEKKKSYSASTASTVDSKDTDATEVNDDEIRDPEMKRKLDLARMYTKDKSQFVQEGNFKVDQKLIISKIGTFLTLDNADEQNSDSSTPESAVNSSTSVNEVNDNSEPPTTFLRTPNPNIGSQKHSKQFSDFIILQKMGEGAYGKVNLCLHKKEKYVVVIKMIFKERILVDTWVRDRNLGTIPSEIQIMATLNKKPHENILRLLDFFEDDDYYYIETSVHGETGCIDLFDLIEFKTNMTEFEAKLIFKQIVSGVRHLHRQGIVHRDIKDENVIVDSKGFVKLIDFGSATYVKSGPFDVFVGTIDYAAPEVLSGDPYEGKPQDIWAIGILLYTIIFKENPFYNIDEILEGELKFDQSEEVSQDCMDLISKILTRKVQKRPTIEDIYQDKWLQL